jgi:hypothetical protein
MRRETQGVNPGLCQILKKRDPYRLDPNHVKKSEVYIMLFAGGDVGRFPKEVAEVRLEKL